MTITLERANAVTTIAQARTLVGTASTEWKNAEEKIGGLSAGRTLSAALATHAAIRTGYLSAGRDLPAGVVNGGTYAELYGVSGGTVTQWRTIARAIVDKGVTPDSYAGKVLLSGRAGDKAISEAVKAADATPETIEAAIKAAGYDERGKRPQATPTPRAAGGNASANTEEQSNVTAPRNNDGRLTVIEQMLSAMSKNPSPKEKARAAHLFGAWSVTWGIVPEGFEPVAVTEAVAS